MGRGYITAVVNNTYERVVYTVNGYSRYGSIQDQTRLLLAKLLSNQPQGHGVFKLHLSFGPKLSHTPRNDPPETGVWILFPS